MTSSKTGDCANADWANRKRGSCTAVSARFLNGMVVSFSTELEINVLVDPKNLHDGCQLLGFVLKSEGSGFYTRSRSFVGVNCTLKSHQSDRRSHKISALNTQAQARRKHHRTLDSLKGCQQLLR